MANFLCEFFGLVFQGFRPPTKIHAQNSGLKLPAVLSSFTFSNPKIVHADFLLMGETKKKWPKMKKWLNSFCWRRTNVQQLTHKMVWYFSLFSLFYSLFSSLWAKTVVKPLNSKKMSWRKNSEKLWKSVKMCGKAARIEWGIYMNPS